MKRTGKRPALIVMLALCLSLMFGTLTVQAKTMKSTKGITWGIQTGKSYTYYSYWGGVGMIKQKVKITNLKDEWTEKLGIRKLSFTITFTRKRKPTAKQLVAAATYFAVKHPELSTSPSCFYAVVDYKTGKNLEADNPYGVSVSDSGWRIGPETTYSIPGYSISMSNASIDVTIEYPYTYKNMCIGVGGTTGISMKSADRRFWAGTGSFWKTKTLRSVKKKKMTRFGRWYVD